jgi:4-hydroxyphenylpyruvate dioxygenase
MTEQARHRNRYDNPKTDKFEVIRFHHLEFTCCDAISTMKLLKQGLGAEIVAESLNATGNHTYASYVLNTHDITFVVTAPYLAEIKHPEDKLPNPKYDAEKAKTFYTRHGTGVSAVGVEVASAREAYETATKNGARGVIEPYELPGEGGKVVLAEVDLYGDWNHPSTTHQSLTVIRFISFEGFKGPFLPGYRAVKDPHPLDHGITKIDHVVGNVWDMDKIVNVVKAATGFHTFSKFSKEEIQTPWTSLNSEVLSSNNERVLFPINEPAPGKKESQITEYLKAYNGPGVQHLALKTSNILATVKAMRERSDVGFEFMNTPVTYYQSPEIIKMMKENLTEEEADVIMEYSILIDKDDEGLLLQIFTKPLFDRPTIFVEIIQRKCAGETIEIPGCGGFGRGNFKALFEAIERMQAERGGLLDDASVSVTAM